MASARSPDSVVTLGRIVGLFGVDGWVKVHSYTRPPQAILEHDVWLVGKQDDWHRQQLREGRQQGRGIVARLAGTGSREQAATLIGADIGVPLQQLPALAQGEYYWVELEGLRVVNLEGVTLGVVSHLLETGANDVIVVVPEIGSSAGASAGKDRLIPYVREVVKQVDLESGILRVDWGLDY
jgi:16S rRNA processing protein RimM